MSACLLSLVLADDTVLTHPTESRYSTFGRAVGHADIDADGDLDLVIGASADGDGDGYDNGAVYLFSGGGDGFGAGSRLAASDEHHGTDSNLFGFGVATSDINGDGFNDLQVGAPGYQWGTGAVYLFAGGQDGIDPSTEQRLMLTDEWDLDTYFGSYLSGGADINGDGLDDLLVGDRVYLGATGELAEPIPLDVTFMTMPGDLNGDGYADLAGYASPFDTDPDGYYVLFGDSSGTAGTAPAFVSGPNRGFGWNITGAGDFDGDGFDDLAMLDLEGGAYVVAGTADGTPTDRLLHVEEEGLDWFVDIAGGVDFDKDGLDDVFVAAGRSSYEGPGLAGADVFYGGGGSELIFAIDDCESPECFATAEGLPDVDGDGFDELALGTYLSPEAGQTVWIVGGRCRDLDGDGFCISTDCDDEDPGVHPGADDQCGDWLDADCDGADPQCAEAGGTDSDQCECGSPGPGEATLVLLMLVAYRRT